MNNLDKQFEAYLAKIAGDSIDNQAVKAAPVRIHYQSKETGILVPLGQSIITGLFAALAVLVAGLALGWSKAWILALVVWAFGSLAMWGSCLMDWRKLVHGLEDISRRDIDGDFEIGEPERCRIEISENEGRRVQFLDLPVSVERLSIMAGRLLEGVTFSEGNMIGSDNLFNRREFKMIQADFVKRGLFEWNSPGTVARGVKLTKSGRAVMRQLAGDHSPTENENS